MNQNQKNGKGAFEPADYPELLEFMPAYLHEDFVDEFGSVAAAWKSFLGEASGDRILQVKEEWVRLRKAFEGRPLGEFRVALEQFGSAWRPQGEEELQKVDEILLRAEA